MNNTKLEWISKGLEGGKRTFHILDDERLNVDDDVIDVGNGDIFIDVIMVPPKSHFLPIPDPAPSSPTDPCYNKPGGWVGGWVISI